MEHADIRSAVPERIVASATDLVDALRTAPYAVVCDFGSDLGFTKRMLEALNPEDTANPGRISFTRIQISAEDETTGGIVTRMSRTNAPIPPHTDWSYSPAPHNLVAFEMIHADDSGGESILFEADRILEHLDAPTIRLLSMPIFPFGTNRYPIIRVSPCGVQVRYYRAQIEKGLELGHPLPENALSALEQLDALLERPDLQRRVRLGTGQVLFFANRRVLHGRTGFRHDSDRLMHRYRLTVPELELE